MAVEQMASTGSGADSGGSRSRPNRRRLLMRAWFLGFTVVLLVLWQLVGMRLNPVLLSTPVRVFQSLIRLCANGTLLHAMFQSLRLLVIGYVSAAVAGIGAGLLMGRYRALAYLLDPWVSVMYSLPKSALAPLLIVWFGIYTSSQIAVVFIAAVLPNILNTYVGVRTVDRSILEVARSYGVTERMMLTRILLPGAFPSIVAGLRLAAGDSAIGVITAELFLQSTGLGGLIRQYQEGLRMDNLLATVLVVATFGYLLTWFARFLEYRLAPWSRGVHEHD